MVERLRTTRPAVLLAGVADHFVNVLRRVEFDMDSRMKNSVDRVVWSDDPGMQVAEELGIDKIVK